jgi:hypothetical protein
LKKLREEGSNPELLHDIYGGACSGDTDDSLNSTRDSKLSRCCWTLTFRSWTPLRSASQQSRTWIGEKLYSLSPSQPQFTLRVKLFHELEPSMASCFLV